MKVRFGVPRQEPIPGKKERKLRPTRNPAPTGLGQYMQPAVSMPSTGLGQARKKKATKKGG